MDILVNDNVINSLFNDKQFNKEFRAMLNGLIDAELAKDVDEMDCDLIDECTDMLIELEQNSDDGFPVIIPPIKAKKIINACKKHDFKSLSRGMRVSVIACVILLSTITCNAAIYKATGRNIAQEVATSINEKLSDWGIVSFAEDAPSETPVKEVPFGNENINDDFDGVTEVTGNENIDDEFDEPSTTPVTVPVATGNENINDDFDDVTEEVTGNENINDDFDEPDTTQPQLVPSANQYIITFDSAGGSVVPSKLVSYGKAMGALPTPEREGYVFKGWYNIDVSYKYNSMAGGAINIKEALPITSSTIYRYKGDAVLTAHWEEAYTITFDPADGTCDVQTMKVDSSGKLPKLPVPVKEGYVFEYWYYKSGSFNLRQNPVDENTVFTADTKLYAMYAPDRTEFKLHFCDDGGYEIAPEGIETLPIRYGEPYGKLPTPEVPAEGMIFIGWFDGKSITDNRITEDTVHSTRDDMYLYALWADDVYTLNFDVNGGNEELESQQAYLGHGFGNLPTPTRYGYNFRCWTYDGTDISRKTYVPDLSDKGTNELTIVATWNAVSVDITFDGNGGDVRKHSFNYTYDSPFKNLPAATRADYEFAGWYTDPEEGELITEDTVINFAEPTVLYAHWVENTENLVYITFHNNRSIDDTYTVAYEPGTVLGEVRAPASTTTTERQFTSFMGWFDDKYYGNEVSAETVIDEDMHIYAHWKLSGLAASILQVRIDNVKAVYQINEQINFDEIEVTLHSNASGIPDASFNEIIEELGETMEEHFYNADTSTPGEHTMTFKFANEAFDIIGVGTLCFEQDVTYTVVGCDHKHTYIRNYIEADCRQKGYTGDVVCEDCDYILEYGKTVEKIPHGADTELELVKGKAPTCTKDGYTDYWRCALCHEIIKGYEVILKLNHPGRKLVDAKAPTCSEYGYTGDYLCTVCGEVTEYGKVVDKLPHGETELANVREATCSEKGYTGDYVCTVCGEIIESGQAIEKLPHGETELVNAIEPTCGEEGYTGDYVCTVCGEITEHGKTIEKISHGETVLVNVREATCGERGYTGDYVCSVCGTRVKRGFSIPTLPHKSTELVNAKEPTCSEQGYTGDTVCKECGITVTRGRSIPRLAHKSTRLVNVKEATCTASGYTGDTMCNDCNLTVTTGKTIEAKGHTAKRFDFVAAGYQRAGSYKETCTTCGKYIGTTTIPAVTYIALSQTSYEYDGNAFNPDVTIKDSRSNVLSKSDYDLIRPSDSVNPGTYTITVKFKGNYEGSYELTYKIVHTRNIPGFTGAVCSSGIMTLSWTAPENADGVQVEIYSFTDKRKLSMTLPKGTNSINVSSNLYQEAYYAIIRSYTVTEVNGQQVYEYSDWSAKYRYYK